MYDLEQRTLEFTKKINRYVSSLPKNISNMENGKQLIRSGGSVGANYREANDNLGKNDFLMRIKISRKEAKETIFWLELTEPLQENIPIKQNLLQEAEELMKIFSAILKNSK
ncbi:MAG: hypothetical protein UU76_C0012G0012 [Parcubacteria group bacterium GW2011_GWC1_41_7]|nr:MAG: hypothetical protein UU76_C0012G0012 [Parcubacteria group bacterium GW2011_GWC1_41_7]